MKAKIVLLSTLLILLTVFIGVSSSEAQTPKKKKKTIKAVVMPTPVPQTIPQIISRADEFPDQDAMIVTENPPVETENTDEKTENSSIEDLNARIKALESSQKNDYDEKQKRLLLNLDILTRSEQRAETLRRQLFEMIEKGNAIQIRIEQIQYDLQPAMIERYAAFAGSLRPEQIREARQRSLESEKRNLESLLTQIQTSRKSLEDVVFKADYLVEKLRTKLEKDIDAALEEKEDQP